MPEIVEVELVRQELERQWKGRTVVSFKKIKPLFKEKNLKEKDLVNQQVVEITRTAKFMYVELSNGLFLMSHLGMTGIWLPIKDQNEFNKNNTNSFTKSKHWRYQLTFDDGQVWYYIDSRGFGNLSLLSERPAAIDILQPSFDFTKLSIWNSDKSIYHYLHNQKFFPGMGAYLGVEMLFYANIHPLTACKDISVAKQKDMQKHLNKVLKTAMKTNGASFTNYLTPKNEKGKMHNFFKVYGRVGEACDNCGTVIDRIEGLRGSQFCPICQPYKGKK